MKQPSVCYMRSSASRNAAPGAACEFDIVHAAGPALAPRSSGTGVRVREDGTYRVELRGYVLPTIPGDIVACIAPDKCSDGVRALCTFVLPCDSVRMVSIADVLAVAPCKAGVTLQLRFATPVTLLEGAAICATRVI